MSNNVININELIKRRQEQSKFEEVTRHRLTIDPGLGIIMSLQHQLNHVYSNALNSSDELIDEGCVFFINMLDLLKVYFHGILLPNDTLHHIHLGTVICDKNSNDGARCVDPMISLTSYCADQFEKKYEPIEKQPLCLIDVRIVSHQLSPQEIPSVDLDDYHIPVVKEAQSQYQRLIKNVLDTTYVNGGCVILRENLLFALTPLSGTHYIQTQISFEDKFYKK